MRILRWLGILIGVYVVFVLLFEFVYLGYMQPSFAENGIPMLDITTTDEAGERRVRKLARFESENGNIYVSAHHWPRGWYHDLMANPRVTVEVDGVAAEYLAIAVAGDEFDQIDAEFPLGFVVNFLMGFPPERDIVRLDPVAG